MCEMTSLTLKGPVHFIWSFFGLFMWRLVVLSQTLSPTFQGVNLEVIHSFIFCWVILWAAWALSRAVERFESRVSRLGRKVLPRGGYARGLYPIMRKNGVFWVTEWVVEL